MIAKEKKLENQRSSHELIHSDLRMSFLPLSKIAKVIDCQHRTPPYQRNGVPVVSPGTIQWGALDLDSSSKYVSEEEFKSLMSHCITEKGDLVFARNQSLGIASYINEEKPFVLGQDTVLIKPIKVDSVYLFYTLQSQSLQNTIFKLAGGSTFSRINLKDLRKLTIPLPPPPEQQKIAGILSTWDEAIEKQQHLVDLLIARKKGLMQQLLTGKKRLPGFSEEWKEHAYGEIIKEVKRPISWNDKELYRLISVRRRSGGLFEREALFGYEIKTKTLKTAKIGDFLISKMQIVHGASGLVTEKFDDMKVSGSYISVRPKSQQTLNIEFLNWYSNLPYFYHQCFVASYGVHIEKMTFDYKSFLKLKIALPTIEEQNKIVEILNAVNQEINIQDQKRISLIDQKKGLMQQLLTGEIPLK